MKIGIIGSGALGLTAALRLTQLGHEVVVIEKEASVGGLVTSFKVGDSYIEKFYHHLFGTDKDIIALIKSLGLEGQLVWKSGKTGTFYHGQAYPLDSPWSLLKFTPLHLVNRLRMGACLAYLKFKGDYHSLEKVTAVSWLKKWMGREAYEVIWKPLLKGKFQREYDQITMSWLWARLYARTPTLGYLRGGFFQLYERLAQRIQKGQGKIQLLETVASIEPEGDRIRVATDKQTYLFDKVLVTLPTNLFFKLTPSLSLEYQQQYQWDDYFGAQVLFLELKRPLTSYYWLNIAEGSFPFLAFVEHTNFMPASDYGGAHLIYLGNYLPTTDPFFKMTEKEVIDTTLPYLKKLNPDFEEDWVKKATLFRAPFAQPVVKVGYRDHIPPHETGINNLYLANMAQVYPWDRGQNYSIKLALEVVALMTQEQS